jgi:hypothetical protein
LRSQVRGGQNNHPSQDYAKKKRITKTRSRQPERLYTETRHQVPKSAFTLLNVRRAMGIAIGHIFKYGQVAKSFRKFYCRIPGDLKLF